jgi:proline iminopeptidase
LRQNFSVGICFEIPDNPERIDYFNIAMAVIEYEKYAKEVLAPKNETQVLKEIMDMEAKETSIIRYAGRSDECYHKEHSPNMPMNEWPESINQQSFESNIYIYMQGHSEFGMIKNATEKSGTFQNV